MMGWLSRAGLFLEKAVFAVSRFLLLIGQVTLVLMVLLTVADVCLRYVFNRPILGSYELTEFMMAVLVFSTIGYTMAVKGHVVVDLVFNQLPQRARDILECITSFMAFILFAIVTWRNVLQAHTAWERHDVTAELFIPISPFILFVALGIAVLSLVLFVQFVQSLTKAIKG
jgi:TRAP-type C4-dicarboxylate transport system permease small subunit